MRIENLETYPAGSEFDVDLVIVGGGPAGLSIAREFLGTSQSVLLLESGLESENAPYTELNRLTSDGDPAGLATTAFRRQFHGENCGSYDPVAQPYGIRFRLLGGTAKYWGGRSATFDDMDFAKRDWMPNSGWPISREKLKPYFDRAAKVLNLGPNCYDETLWPLIEEAAPIKRPPIDPVKLRSHFWQFARSPLIPTQMVHFGDDFRQLHGENVRTLLNATVTHITTRDGCATFDSLEISTLAGVRSKVKARRCVLACGCIENARLLLISNRQAPAGVGNAHDVVGRYLMDHPGTRIGSFAAGDIKAASYLGFYALRRDRRLVMYTHGLKLSAEVQAAERLHNAAVYVLPEIAPDDPIEALKRLLRLKSKSALADLWALLTSAGLLAKSIGAKLFQSKLVPRFVQDAVIDLLMRVNPNFVVREFQSKGVPHKLRAMGLHVMVEQRPDPESRIELTDAKDALGSPRVRVTWKISQNDRQTALRLAQLLAEELPKAGMPAPQLEDWAINNRPEDAPLVDMAHSVGATRMSDDPRFGVVDSRCEVHGVKGLYVAGGSVFPTSGQCNPTLMIVTISIWVADQIKADLAGTRPIHPTAVSADLVSA